MSAEIVHFAELRLARSRPRIVDPGHLRRAAARALRWAEIALQENRQPVYRRAARRIREAYLREAQIPELMQLAECMAKRARTRR